MAAIMNYYAFDEEQQHLFEVIPPYNLNLIGQTI